MKEHFFLHILFDYYTTLFTTHSAHALYLAVSFLQFHSSKIETKANDLNLTYFTWQRQVLEVIKHPRVGVWYQKECSIHISSEGNNYVKYLIYNTSRPSKFKHSEIEHYFNCAYLCNQNSNILKLLLYDKHKRPKIIIDRKFKISHTKLCLELIFKSYEWCI